MKKRQILLLCLFISINSFSQNSSTLNIVGEAKKMVLPDKAIFSIDLSATKDSESESFDKLNEYSSQLLKKLKSEGFSEDQIKMKDFSLEKMRNTAKKKVYFVSKQSIYVSFPLDKKRIFKTYSALMKENIEGLEIQLETECSDELKNKTQEELIVLALKDAKRKAEIITKASDCLIQSIANIGYKYYSEESTTNSVRFVPPVIKPDEQVSEDEISSEMSNYLSVYEEEFNEEVKVSYFIQNTK